MSKRCAQRVAIVLLALLFGLGFGLNYGTSNQAVYLLGAIKALHPSLWTRDWVVTHAHGYHPAYVWLATWLLRPSPSGLLIAWSNVVLIGVCMLAVFTVVRSLTRAHAFPAFCLLLVIASVTRTLAPGGSYAFAEYFQPSTLGSVGFLLAAAAFVAGRPAASGLSLALGGAFHVNYLVLGLCVFGVAWLLRGRDRLAWNLLLGLGPAIAVLTFFLPFLLASASPGISAQAQRIYQDVRSPHHYRVPRFAWDFAAWTGFQLLGAAGLVGPARRGGLVQRRLLALLFGCWALIIPCALLSSVVVVPFIRQLMAWRVCAQAELLAQASLSVALVSLYCNGRSALSEHGRSARILVLLGLGALFVGALAKGHGDLTLLVFVLCGVAAAIQRGWLGRFTDARQAGLSLGTVTAIVLLTLLGVNVARVANFARYSNVLSGGDPGLAQLCRWARQHTPENALFLSPPAEDELRFRCERAVVVDWKAVPAVPAEILEWFERVENVTGRHPIRSDADLKGYDELDASRVAKLRERYGVDYVVVERGHELDLGAAPVFSGGRFVAYALGVNPASAR